MNINLEEERKTLIRKYRQLISAAQIHLKPGDTQKIKKAYLFAIEAHKDMRRHSGEPFVYHPIAVAMICVTEIGLGTTSIIAALLHDVVEDTDYDLKYIEERFGAKVALIIDGLTKIRATTSKTNTSMQAENFRKMLLTISQDMRVVLIKIADRLHNMRTLDSMRVDKRLKIKAETEYIYAPLAHRLGLYSIKSELEDLSLKFSDREMYNYIVQKLQESEAARQAFTNDFIQPIEGDLVKEKFDFEIKSRTKSIRSIYNKMKKQNIPFEEVYDLFAIRVIFKCDDREKEKANCWQIYSIVTDYYTPSPDRLRDWISLPKANGYESLHVTVMGHEGHWVEVQIRSERMDEIAEKGYAAHWKYKTAGGVDYDRGLERWLHEIRGLLENDKLSAIEFLDEFRSNLYINEIYVFTPKGDLKVFGSGATVLDFAFDIHTQVGARALGAKINGKLVPLNHKLETGDQVEILTSNKVKANEGWLKFVTTSKARNKIKEYLKEERKRSIELGKEIIIRKLRHLKIDINEVIVHQLMDFFEIKSEPDFYYRVGEGTIDHTQIKQFRDFKKEKEKHARTIDVSNPKEIKEKIRALRKDDDELIVGQDRLDIDYKIASCCTPISGDDIFGFVTINDGVKIHRTNCPNAVFMMANYGYRIIKARWASQKKEEFDVTILLEGIDRLGMIMDITKVISGQKVNISSIAVNTKNTIFQGQIGLSVHDRSEVEDLIFKLEALEGVYRVTRVESVVA